MNLCFTLYKEKLPKWSKKLSTDNGWENDHLANASTATVADFASWPHNILYHYNVVKYFSFICYYSFLFLRNWGQCLTCVWSWWKRVVWKQKLRTHSNGLALPSPCSMYLLYNCPNTNLLLNKKQTNILCRLVCLLVCLILSNTFSSEPKPHLAVGQNTFVWIKNK